MLGSARNYRFLHEARWPAIDPSTDSVKPFPALPSQIGVVPAAVLLVADTARTIVAFSTGRETLWIS